MIIEDKRFGNWIISVSSVECIEGIVFTADGKKELELEIYD
jgi:hypothetical protein